MPLSSVPRVYCVLLQPDRQTTLVGRTIASLLNRRTDSNTNGTLAPHIMLAGPTVLKATVTQIVNSLGDVIRSSEQFEVVNSGVTTANGVVGYDLNGDKKGRTNTELVALAVWINCAMKKLAKLSGTIEEQFSTGTFHATLPLISLSGQASISSSATEDFIRRLELPVPGSFTAEVVSLIELASENWSSSWWESTNWTHHHSWYLPTIKTATAFYPSYPLSEVGGAGWLRQKRRQNRLRNLDVGA